MHKDFDRIDAETNLEFSMEIKPIKTETDFEAALKEIESLFDAEPGIPEGDRLEFLSTLVEAYEGEHYDISAPDRNNKFTPLGQ